MQESIIDSIIDSVIEIDKGSSTMSISMSISMIESMIDSCTGRSTLHEIEIEIDNLININMMLRPKPSRKPPDPRKHS